VINVANVMGMTKKLSFLEEAIEAAKLKERERIIELLEEADSACGPWAIALIKGEK
jgi:hypothetical protein